MSLDGFWFACKSAVKNFFRNAFLSIASVTILSVCLIILASTFLLVLNANSFVDAVGNESQIVIFLDETLTPAEIRDVQNQLDAIDNIANITYESPEQAFENYYEAVGDEGLAEGLDASVFRPSYTFELIDLGKYDQTVYEVSKISGIGYSSSSENSDELAIQSSKATVDSLVKIREVLMILSVCIVLLFLVVSFFIIINSVKLSVFSRRVEINIMKYVGATDFYIRLPYFIEGMIIGAFSGIIGFFAEKYIYDVLLCPILGELGGFQTFSPINIDAHLGLMFLLFIAAGLVVGIIGSVVPVRKYVNV